MKLLTANNLSTLTSLLFHACLVLFLIFTINLKSPVKKDQVVEIGFGGTSETNSPGSPGGSIVEHDPKIKKPEPLKTKEKLKQVEETISEKKEKVKKANETIASSDSSKGNSSGSLIAGNSGEGSGTVSGSGNGQSGSGAPKKGLYIPNDIYYVAVDQMPVPIGGMHGINARAFYPPSAKAKNIQGTVYVLAFIDERGFVKKISLLKGIGFGCDESAERAVKDTRFEPGQMHGIPVKVQLTIPITFSPNN